MITHFFDEGKKLLAVFKWGQTFLTLNNDPLMDYSSANDPETIATVEESYFGLRGTSPASHN
jgi:pre-rRNA-processing protein TSR3